MSEERVSDDEILNGPVAGKPLGLIPRSSPELPRRPVDPSKQLTELQRTLYQSAQHRAWLRAWRGY